MAPRIPHLFGIAAPFVFCTAAFGQSSGLSAVALKQLSLDELLNVDVTSVSKTSETYRDAAAAIVVVTDEHIARSGATNVPDALRWVPGLHVARRDSNTWAISARGFSSVNSEKLLVLSDTRSIYTPLFSGVLWDVQDYLMADIERIEVIRGPGAALWGSNAVNGVINITTKHASDTHGAHVETGFGTEERTMVSARYGSATTGGIHYRVFGRYSDRDETLNHVESSDDWQLGHVGFRADWAPHAEDEYTLQANAYRGDVGQLGPAVRVGDREGPTGNLKSRVAGGNILGRWRHRIRDDSDIQLRAYYDRTHRNDPSYRDDLDTVDLDLQHRFSPALRHQVTWGVNYRTMSNRDSGKGIFRVLPSRSEDDLLSAFLQDQIAVTDSVQITVGTKFEHNDFSGTEWQPGVRATWDVAPDHTLWAAVSRAARIPTRLERDIAIDVTDPDGNPIVRLLGSKDFESEEVVAYELGYRWRASNVLHIDLSLFENDYDKLASLEVGDPFIDPDDGRTVVPIINENLTSGRARGAESLITYTPFETWRLSASYSHLHMSLDPGGQDLNRGEFYEGATPRHQFALGSYLDLPGGFQLDAHFRRHSEIRQHPSIPSGEGIPGYSELDIHVSWRASDRTRITIVGQNLLHDHHVEFGSPDTRGALRRGVYAKIAWDL